MGAEGRARVIERHDAAREAEKLALLFEDSMCQPLEESSRSQAAS